MEVSGDTLNAPELHQSVVSNPDFSENKQLPDVFKSPQSAKETQQSAQSTSVFTSAIGLKPVKKVEKQETQSTAAFPSQEQLIKTEQHCTCIIPAETTGHQETAMTSGISTPVLVTHESDLLSIPLQEEAVVSVDNGVVTVKPSSSDSYCLAESELVEVDTAHVTDLLQYDVVADTEDSTSNELMSTSSAETTTTDSSTFANRSANWPHSETLRLIHLYKEYQHYFADKHYKKKMIWAMLAAKLAKGSKSKVKFTSTQVYNRWKNLTRMYREFSDNLEQVGPRVGKWLPRYFEEMSSIAIDKSSIPKSQRKHGYQPHSTKYDKMASQTRQCAAERTFKPIAPKTQNPPSPGRNAVLVPSTNTEVNYSYGSPEDKSVDEVSNSACGSTYEDVVKAVQKLHEDQREIDEWKLGRLEQMHNEKMQMFGQFLDILKEYKQ